jgi:hypothetical protein
MNKNLLAVLTLSILILTVPAAGAEDNRSTRTVNVVPLEWQKKSLQGITSLRYRLVSGPADIAEVVATSLKNAGLPVKQLQKEEDVANPLSTTEGRLVVYTQDRENDQSWVGLSLEQKCQLVRNPAIQYESESYRAGKLVQLSQTTAAIKELSDQFVQLLKAANSKKSGK